MQQKKTVVLVLKNILAKKIFLFTKKIKNYEKLQKKRSIFF
jgi:hypothetical protein